MNKKGFTLIELIAVIVILGMLLMIVLPATSRIMSTNDKREYDEYYKLIRAAAIKYARGRAPELGGATHSGCIEDLSLDTLIYSGILKKFTKNEEIIECFTPGYPPLGVNINEVLEGKNPNDYFDIRIKNNKGTITVQYSLICVRNNTKVVYSKLVEKDGATCKPYKAEEVNQLYNKISGSITSDPGKKTQYITTANNYVKYSGKLWRIVSVDTQQKTIKIVLDDVITYLNYDDSASAIYPTSNISTWIDQKFKPTLRNASVFIQDTKWNYNGVASASSEPASVAAKEIQSTVGLLTAYDHYRAGSYITASTNTPYFLLSSNEDANMVYYVKSNNTTDTIGPNNFAGVRPAIVLRTGVTYLDGADGTRGNPYVILGDKAANIGEKLNTRYVGEKIFLGNATYTIVEVGREGTKVMSKSFSDDTFFDNTNIYKFGGGAVSGTVAQSYYDNIPGAEKDQIIEQEYCTDVYLNNSKYNKDCDSDDVRIGYYSLPRIGDMYAIPSNSDSYWTVSVAEERDRDPLVQLMTPSGITASNIRTNGKVYPVFMLSPDTKIFSGDGSSIPYKIVR